MIFLLLCLIILFGIHVLIVLTGRVKENDDTFLELLYRAHHFLIGQ